ncbi:MAG: hypothetical protein L0Z50_30045 [Verrucomicrobiales bacterium]|nr:hypothetical protein [Verrucomicrobiales bacterium]
MKDVTLLRFGPGSVVLVAAYALGIRLLYQQKRDEKESKEQDEESASRISDGKKLKFRGAIFGYAITAGVILAAAPFLAQAADDLAELERPRVTAVLRAVAGCGKSVRKRDAILPPIRQRV